MSVRGITKLFLPMGYSTTLKCGRAVRRDLTRYSSKLTNDGFASAEILGKKVEEVFMKASKADPISERALAKIVHPHTSCRTLNIKDFSELNDKRKAHASKIDESDKYEEEPLWQIYEESMQKNKRNADRSKIDELSDYEDEEGPLWKNCKEPMQTNKKNADASKLDELTGYEEEPLWQIYEESMEAYKLKVVEPSETSIDWTLQKRFDVTSTI